MPALRISPADLAKRMAEEEVLVVDVRQDEPYGNSDLKIAIELDGPYHLKTRAQEKDRKKENLLKYHGWSVLRFKDVDVETNLDGVMKAVATCIASR